ncbi:MAG: VOC family protein [bacterium]
MTPPEGTMYPCLYYNDALGAIDWLKRVFGFREIVVIAEPDGRVAHSEIALGAGVVMVGSSRKEVGYPSNTLSPRDLPGINQSCYVFVANVRDHYEHAKAAGAEIAQDYFEPEYGGAMYGALDLEGHPWSFGSYAPDLSGGAPA